MKIIHINDYLLPFLLLLMGVTIGIQRQEIQTPSISQTPTSLISSIPDISSSLPRENIQNNTGTNDKGNTCIYHIDDDNITVNTACLLSPSDELLSYNFTGIIEKQRKDIAGFSEIYDDTVEKFTYHQAYPLRKIPEKQAVSEYRRWKISKINTGDKQQTYSFSRTEWSIIAMNLYSYFPTDRDISEYGSCSSRNYYVATISIDKKFVSPNEEFNLNRRIAYRTGYCKSSQDKNPFNSGVCGAATQIFRIALLDPDIKVVERENHQIWYSKYYGTILRGDDAGIAQFYKKLTIKNKGDVPLYFKYRDQEPDKRVGIVAIAPTHKYATLETTIEKQQLGPLEAQVTSTSILSGEKYTPRLFHSQYTKIVDDAVN